MDLANEKFLKKVNLCNRQKRLNEMFEEEGLTDTILKEQLEINKERHNLDIPDESEFMYQEFVQ
ncbi:hypothetical protein [Methanobrevibacter olleyae]|uniref:Uncharacterized protein n=1 Tax=Methanobrevibacter olleyae TaxID=294671 RepID=A0A126R2N7_METOL|nr:hypothetical protein [Methanobrevibacter olleyae]AMK16337.1 hypothetical protein YLM1_1782 [Methanobrevibacter olleyae]